MRGLCAALRGTNQVCRRPAKAALSPGAAMTEKQDLHRETFERKMQLKALRVPYQESSRVRDLVHPFLLSLKRVKPIQSDQNPDTKLILLNEASSVSLPEAVVHLTENEDVELIDYELSVGYDRMSAAEILRELLPEDVVVPTAFEGVGRVAHLNLRPEHVPYRHAIGQVLIDKNPSISTAVNKVGTVENEFRLMEYEVLAGDPSLETEVRQGGCRYQLDFGKVYWNSRLEYEHTRLVDQFRPGEIVLDLMAGIGPFAIPAAKKGCFVVANDKNPDSFVYLTKNITLNKVMGSVLPLNLDARFCLRMVLGCEGSLKEYLPENYVTEVERFRNRRRKKRGHDQKDLSSIVPSLPLRFHHVVMNYPQYAVDFLDMFPGAFDPQIWSDAQMPIVHCYTFMKDDEDEEALIQKCQHILGGEIKAEIHIVRDVAPSKVMCCIRFRLPSHIAHPPPTIPGQSNPPHDAKSPEGSSVKKRRSETDER